MNRKLFAAGACALLCTTVPLLAQASRTPDIAMATGGMSATDVGASPMTGTPSATYVMMAADGDMYEIQSSQLALGKSKDAKVKAVAKEMIADHRKTTSTLMAALPKTSPRVAKPPMKLSAENAAMIAQLKQAPAGGFDALYLQQQAQAHQKAWSLHKGYATDGTDPALRQVATSAVPIIEKHLQHLKGMPMGAM